MVNRILWGAVLTVLLLAGCGRSRTVPVSPALPVPTQVLTPVNLLTDDLLTASGATAACDAAEGATIVCATVDAGRQIEVTVNASVFARWRIQLNEIAQPLTGVETLRIVIRSEGDLAPNLYLVERDGDRIPVPLRRLGLRTGEQTLYLPLAEIADEQGNRPDFGAVSELQIVFEWADMAGALTLEELRFLPVWEEEVTVGEAARSLAEQLVVPAGFVAEPVADQLSTMTQFGFQPGGDLLVSQQNGRIWWYHDDDGDGSFDRRHLYTAGFTEIVGMLADPIDGAVWFGGRGQLYRTADSNGDGVADVRELRIDGLPWGRHQNNGLAWNPGPDPFSGEEAAHWLYFGLGSTGDLEEGGPINATILRFPRDGQSVDDLEVISRGNRNSYMLVWAALPVDLAAPDGPTTWQLFASENGPDFNDAPDEVNHIRRDHHYGFPVQFGAVAPDAKDGEPFSGPVYPVTAHASADGLAYVNNPTWPAPYRTLYVSLFGQVFSEKLVGHIVEGVTLRLEETRSGPTYRGEPFAFVTGLDRPLPLITDPGGDLLVGDYATGVIYRIRYAPPNP